MEQIWEPIRNLRRGLARGEYRRIINIEREMEMMELQNVRMMEVQRLLETGRGQAPYNPGNSRVLPLFDIGRDAVFPGQGLLARAIRSQRRINGRIIFDDFRGDMVEFFRAYRSSERLQREVLLLENGNAIPAFPEITPQIVRTVREYSEGPRALHAIQRADALARQSRMDIMNIMMPLYFASPFLITSFFIYMAFTRDKQHKTENQEKEKLNKVGTPN